MPPATHTNCIIVGDGSELVVIDPASPYEDEPARLDAVIDQLAEYFEVTHGVLITWVTRQSAARKAGLMAGDVVTELAGEPVHRERDLVLILQELRDEDSVDLQVTRKGQGKTLSVTFDE